MSINSLGLNIFWHGKYTFKEHDDLLTKYTQLAKKLKALEMKNVHEIRTEDICVICNRQGHSTGGCPTLPAYKEVLQSEDHVSVTAMNQYNKPFKYTFPNTYNPG